MRTGTMRIMFRLAGMVKPLAHIMLITIIMGTAGYLCSSFMLICGAYAFLEVLGIKCGISLGIILVLIPLLAVLRVILRYGEQISGHYIAFRLLALIRDQVFKALRRLAPARLEGKDKGDLIAVIGSDIELLEVFYAHTIAPVAIAIITSVIMTVFIASYNIFLGLLALLSYIIVGFFIPRVLSKRGRSSGANYRREFGRLNSYYLDSLRGIKEIIQFGHGDKRLYGINQKTDELNGYQKILKSHEGITRAVSDAVVLVLSLSMLLTCSYLFFRGKLEYAGVLIPTVALFSTFGPVVALSNLSNNLMQTVASGRRVLAILDETPAVADISHGKRVSFKHMRCENISFAYDEEAVLENLSIQIPPHRILGITGKSGSGKTTLLKLMMRFWDPRSGYIKISEQDIRHINTRNLRDMESYVTQETCLFHDTIGNNIKIAKLDASPAAVAAAAQKAGIHEFIMSLPEAYQTNVGELGNRLSDGEGQRIGLARAFLHDAPLILLDEPTSNLDSLNEALILKSLKTQCQSKTVVLVSHRNSTMRIADTLFSIDSGRLS